MNGSNGLPASWIYAPLGELGTWRGGGTPNKARQEFWSGGAIPWFSPKDMKSFRLQASEDQITDAALESSSVDLFPPNTVLMVVRSGILEHTFPVAVASVVGTMNQDLKGLTPPQEIDATYLAYALRASGRDVLNKCSKAGTTVASIEVNALRSHQIPLAPAGEQRRIVSKLDELLSDLDSGIAALKRAEAKLNRYRAAVLKAAVEGRLTEEWRAAHADIEPAEKLLDRILVDRRKKWEEAQLAKYAEKGQSPPRGWKERYPEPVTPDVSAMPALPARWRWTTVDQLSWVVRGASPRPAGDPRYFGGNDVPWITVGAITENDDQIYLRSTKEFLTKEGRNHSRFIEPDTLLLTNSGATLGVPKITLVGGCINDGSVALLGPSEVLRHYLYYFLRTRTRSLRALNQGAAQPNLNTDIVRAIFVPLPPEAEQAQIVREIEEYESRRIASQRAIVNAAARSIVLRQSVLKRAFEGKLVPQDPNDEPASALLERIRGERSGEKHVRGGDGGDRNPGLR